ncbi:hypothetical protein HAZT_HAZT000609 [Hyalella azteca]|uniref:39S ribosomal protein L46, mitochondrial n=1 Tax=Hyalella azteca TaxID=294128 RepID=A0A6A0GPU9_HYAAZ|nr:39S ribosomal protein L46, mitochondrial [Hyalella azteca]KAA0184092.1 hypothetical protein HAZT_HAZT000609 [Hyalella azteca]
MMMRYSFLSLVRNAGSSRALTTNIRFTQSQDHAVSPASTNVADHNETLGNKGIGGWQIMTAVCVTRHPVLCPPLSPMEHTYSQHLQKLDVEQSLQCDFELQVIEDNAKKLLGVEEEVELLEEEAKEKRSALEQLDVWKQEQEEFEKERVYEVKASGGSVGSSLSRQVVLVQKYKLGSQDMWLLPQGPWKPGETLRQTSERVVAECCDPSLGVRIMGNAPVGFYKYKYPKEMRSQGYIGAKVFFYRGQVGYRVRRSLPLLQLASKKEQQWLTHEQLSEKLKQNYVKAITQFLIDDS